MINQDLVKQYPGISALTSHIENLLDTSNHSIYWKDKNGSYISANKYFLNLNHMKQPEELIGKSDFDLNWDVQAPILYINDQQVMCTEITKTYIEPIKVEKHIVWFLSHKQPLYSRSGNVIGTFGQSIMIHDGKTDKNLPIQLEDDECQSVRANSSLAKEHQISEEKFSRRQTQCLYYLVLGMTAKQIAKILVLSPRTVEFYIAGLKKKLNCSSRSDLIMKATQMEFMKSLFTLKSNILKV